MIIKMQPEEFERKPLISEGDPDGYLGRVIIEFWCEDPKGCEDPAFAWSVDDPALPDEQWYRLFLNGLQRATRHIEDVYHYRQEGG